MNSDSGWHLQKSTKTADFLSYQLCFQPACRRSQRVKSKNTYLKKKKKNQQTHGRHVNACQSEQMQLYLLINMFITPNICFGGKKP